MAADSLLVLSECRSALAEAKTFDDVRLCRDKAEATRLLLQIRGESVAMQNEAAEVAILAEIRLGEALGEMNKRKNQNAAGNSVLLADVGVTKIQSSRWQSMAAAKSKVPELRREADEQDKELTRASVYKMGRKILSGDGPPKRTRDEWNVGDWITHLRSRVDAVYEESPKDFRSMMANVLRSLADNVDAWEAMNDGPGRGVGEESTSAA